MNSLTPALAEVIARRFAVLGDPTRIRILDALHEREETAVGELAAADGGSHANVSKHLQVMLVERMVARRRDGTRVLYRISDPSLIELCEQVCAGARQSLEELNRILDPTPAQEAP